MLAWTRGFGEEIGRCELTHLGRVPIDVVRAAHQHAVYEQTLRALGCEVRALPRLPDHPDAVFVEDTAVILDEVVVLTRPGAPSRRGEVESVERALAVHRTTVRLTAPARLDGGDVLRLGRILYVGRSARTDDAGIAALAAIARPLGYDVIPLSLRGCLHLKTASTEVADGTLLVQPEWLPASALGAVRTFPVDPAEPYAANVLRVGDTVIVPSAHPRTRRRLEAEGLSCVEVDASELAKAEAGVTCCSLVMRDGVE